MYLERLPGAFEVGELNSQPDLELLGKGARVRRLPLLALQPATCILAPRQLQRSTWSGRRRHPVRHGIRPRLRSRLLLWSRLFLWSRLLLRSRLLLWSRPLSVRAARAGLASAFSTITASWRLCLAGLRVSF